MCALSGANTTYAPHACMIAIVNPPKPAQRSFGARRLEGYEYIYCFLCSPIAANSPILSFAVALDCRQAYRLPNGKLSLDEKLLVSGRVTRSRWQ